MYCLQPRRRDFSRSSQGLPDLASALHGLHTHQPTPWYGQQTSQPSATDWQNTMLPRDPSSALPHPHQRPATAADTSFAGFVHTSGQRHQQAGHAYPYRQSHLGPVSQLGLQDQLYSYDLRPQSEAGLRQHPGQQRDEISVNSIASHPQREHCGGFVSQHPYQQDGHAIGHDWSRPGTAKHMLEREGYQPSRLQHFPEASTRPAWGKSRELHSQQTARSPVAESVSLRTQSAEPSNQHECFAPQTISGLYSNATHDYTTSRMDWAAQAPVFGRQQQQQQHVTSLGDQRGTPCVRQPVPGLAQPTCSAYDKNGFHVQSEQFRAQAPDVDDIAAMEAVLSEYKALRSQISEAEAQLEGLQRGPAPPDALSRPQSSSQRKQGEPSYQQGHGYLPGKLHGVTTVGAHKAHLADVTNTLTALKGAAAKQRPAVEAVAQQLQNVLSRVCHGGTAAK